MKQIIILICLFLLSLSVFAQKPTKRDFDIIINVSGLTDSVAYLGYHFGQKRYLLDTSEIPIKKGRIRFRGKKVLYTGVYFLHTKTYYTEFVIDGAVNFTIDFQKEDPYESRQIKGSQSNVAFRDFNILMIAYQQKMRTLTSSLDSLSTKQDTIDVRAEIAKLNTENKSQRESMQASLGGSYIGQLLRIFEEPELKMNNDSLTMKQKKAQYDYYKSHFFDGLDFNSFGLMRAPNFYGKVKKYLDQVTFQNPDSIIASVDFILEKAKNNEELYRYWLVNFFQDYQNAKIMGMDKVFVHIADHYYLNQKVPWADSAMIASLNKEMKFHRENQLGQKAPQIYLQDTLGNSTSLYGQKADYLVLFFYDPDCGHCKKKAPVLRDLYYEMDGEFEVVAITVGTDKDKWKKFIKKFELDWINLGDLDYQSNFRMQYNVRSTPQVFVLDKDKKIIAKELGVDQIGEFLKEYKKVNQFDK